MAESEDRLNVLMAAMTADICAGHVRQEVLVESERLFGAKPQFAGKCIDELTALAAAVGAGRVPGASARRQTGLASGTDTDPLRKALTLNDKLLTALFAYLSVALHALGMDAPERDPAAKAAIASVDAPPPTGAGAAAGPTLQELVAAASKRLVPLQRTALARLGTRRSQLQHQLTAVLPVLMTHDRGFAESVVLQHLAGAAAAGKHESLGSRAGGSAEQGHRKQAEAGTDGGPAAAAAANDGLERGAGAKPSDEPAGSAAGSRPPDAPGGPAPAGPSSDAPPSGTPSPSQDDAPSGATASPTSRQLAEALTHEGTHTSTFLAVLRRLLASNPAALTPVLGGCLRREHTRRPALQLLLRLVCIQDTAVSVAVASTLVGAVCSAGVEEAKAAGLRANDIRTLITGTRGRARGKTA
ncbi:hypothetical protein FNF27_08099 [Cafeteria roenbergensis]|uniref:Uncharacterized protein n=1 Tax=Cafeteria roenbergensis TaxID=33653 RepID=A0A5A8DAT1_CAFRO|nr:hypothetical protein FNF27_08099 [Cafeteria roenbergensis]